MKVTLQKVLQAMLQRALDGKDGSAYPTDRWVENARSTYAGDRIKLTEADGKLLVEAGLVDRVTSGTHHYKLTPEGIRQTLPHVSYEPLNIKALLIDIFEGAVFNPLEELDGETPIPWVYTPGTCKLVLVLGENAGGKSFFRRMARYATHPGKKGGWGEKEIPPGRFPVREFIHLSMEGRTNRYGGMAGMVYGNEDYRSTGENSSRTVSMGIKTASGRAHPSILYWDEPDIGMSGAAAAGAGIAIREMIERDPPLVQAVFVTTHSLHMVHELAPLDPHYIYLGDAQGPATLDAWFESQMSPTPISPEDLQERSHRRFRAIQALLNRNKP